MGYLLLLLILGLYFSPSMIAGSNEHSKTASIFVINLFFGWTFVGWVIALAWAVSESNIGK